MNFTTSALLAVVMVVATSLTILYITHRIGIPFREFREEKQLTVFGSMFDSSAIFVVGVIAVLITMIVLPKLTDPFIISVAVCPQIIIGYTLALLVVPRIRWVEDKLYEIT